MQRSAYQWKQTASGRKYYLYDDEDLVCELNAAGHALAGVIFVANNTPYGYKGQWGDYTDGETGLLLLTHRFLDPATSRFLPRDPIGFEGGINLYAYVGNGVMNKIDSDGLVVHPLGRWALHRHDVQRRPTV